jgi:hypothetical protein
MKRTPDKREGVILARFLNFHTNHRILKSTVKSILRGFSKKRGNSKV